MIRFAAYHFALLCVYIATEVEAFRKIVFYNPLCSIYTQLTNAYLFFHPETENLLCVLYERKRYQWELG